MTYTSRGTRHVVRRMKNELNEEKVLGRPFLVSVPCVVSLSWRHRFLLSCSLKVQL